MLHALLLQGGQQTGTQATTGGLAASAAQVASMGSGTVLAVSFRPLCSRPFATHLVAGCSSRPGDTRAAAASSQRPVSNPQLLMAVRKPAAAVTTASSASASACCACIDVVSSFTASVDWYTMQVRPRSAVAGEPTELL
jgi:hypothetical protein